MKIDNFGKARDAEPLLPDFVSKRFKLVNIYINGMTDAKIEECERLWNDDKIKIRELSTSQ